MECTVYSCPQSYSRQPWTHTSHIQDHETACYSSEYKNDPFSPLQKAPLAATPWRPRNHSKYNDHKRCITESFATSYNSIVEKVNKIPFSLSHTGTDPSPTNDTEIDSTGITRANGYSKLVRNHALQWGKHDSELIRQGQEISDEQIGKRKRDIDFMLREFETENGEMVKSIQRLNEAKRRADKVFLETDNPLHVAMECIYLLEKMCGLDAKLDGPECALVEEIDTITFYQNKIGGLLDEYDNQQIRNDMIQQVMFTNSSEKFLARQIDNKAHGLNNKSSGLDFFPGIQFSDHSKSNLISWNHFTFEILEQSKFERNNNQMLIKEIEDTLKDCLESLWKTWNATNVALCHRVQETLKNKAKVNRLLGGVIQEISEADKCLHLVMREIETQEESMKLAQTRLNIRLQRPNVEHCRDLAHEKIIEEIVNGLELIYSTRRRLDGAEKSLDGLHHNKTQLRDHLDIVNNALFVDREKCLAMRNTFPMQHRIA